MIITVTNFKGGSGKSLSSYFIAFSDKINADIYSNDPNGIYQSIFDKYNYIEDINSIDLSKVDKSNNILFDLGGFAANVGNILKKSNVIVVPTLSDVNSIKVCLDSVSEFLSYNKNIIVVETMYKTGSMLEEAIADNFPDEEIPVLKLRYAKIFDNAIRAGKTVDEYIKNDKLKQITYKNSLNDMKDIIEVVNIIGGYDV